jgi:WD40 repeat protein
MIWELASGKALRTIFGTGINPTFYSLDGTKIPDWRFLAGAQLSLSTVAYSPDGTRILSGFGWRQGAIRDATTGESLFYLPGWYADEVWSVAYSADGKYVALGGQTGAIGIWDAETVKQLLSQKGHGARVYAIAFSPDSKWIVAASADGTLQMWAAATGENLLSLPVDSGGTGGISFSPDGKRLAVGGKSGIYVFVLPIDELIALAKSRVTRSLTAEECQQYLHVESCPVEP